MSKKMLNIIIIGILFVLMGILSGCINEQKQDNQKENNNVDQRFIGTWTGNLAMSEKGTNITEFKFTASTVDLTMEFEWEDYEDKEGIKDKEGEYTITYNYNVQGEELVIETTSDKGGKTSRTIFSYNFSDNNDVLYLDGSEFIKTN